VEVQKLTFHVLFSCELDMIVNDNCTHVVKVFKKFECLLVVVTANVENKIKCSPSSLATMSHLQKALLG